MGLGWLFVLSFRRGWKCYTFFGITLYFSNPVHTPSQIRAFFYDVQDLGLLRVSLYNNNDYIFLFLFFRFGLHTIIKKNCAFLYSCAPNGA